MRHRASKPFRIAIAAAIALASNFATFAQGLLTAYDSFGPRNAYNYWAALPLSGGSGGFAFTPSVSGKLHSVELPLVNVFLPNAATIALCRTDLTTGFPSRPLELFSANGLMPSREQNPVAPLSFRSSLEPVLEASTQYWLVLTVPPEANVEWYSVPGDFPSRYYYSNPQNGEGFGT